MKKSFTLIELMVVIAIIGILGVVITPVVGRAITKARKARVIADLDGIEKAIGALYIDTGKVVGGCHGYVATGDEIMIDPNYDPPGPAPGYGGSDWAGLIKRPPLGRAAANCEWVQPDIDTWDGPYIKGGTAIDPWGTSYIYDSDYGPCHDGWAFGDYISDCPDSPELQEMCLAACGGSFNCYPVVIQSFGPDRNWVTPCDDISRLLIP
jgi:prepilin-type N-terminal cleavage/methylation domain-containing protein